MFDEGAQMNIISRDTVDQLQLSPDHLPYGYRLYMANHRVELVTQIIRNFRIEMSALDSDNNEVTLYFSLDFLVMDASFNLLVGIPFTDFHQFIPHYCNNTYVYTSRDGHRVTIPLHNSLLTASCSHKFCPFFTPLPFPSPLPNYPPFVPPIPYQHTAPSAPPIHLASVNLSPDTDSTPSLDHCFISTFDEPTVDPILLFLTSEHSPESFISSKTFLRLAKSPQNEIFVCLVKTATPSTSSDLSPEATALRDQMLQRFPSAFPSELPSDSPPSDRIHHAIDLVPNHSIPPRRLYRQTPDELQETKRQIEEYLAAGHVRPSTSPFGAPVLLVKKKDGSMRMCIDYRGLNKITEKNNFPLPRIDDLHDRLTNAKYFTKLDLFAGYHQIPIKLGDEFKTAFTSRYGTYEFVVMPFGLTNAPATFQTAMNALFYDWLDDFVIVYLDDILIYSESLEQHHDHVTRVLQRLCDNKWYCKLKKCDFASRHVEYLGHIISDGTIAIDKSKLKAILEWPVPFKNLKETQSYLGATGYFRKFVEHYSHKARPLHNLARKDTKFVWTDAHTNAVKQLNESLVNPKCLALFDSHRDTFLTTDACDYAMGAVLSQKYDSGERPIAFLSKSFDACQMNYSMWEKELFAVVWSVRELRPYLRSHHFTLRSDNKPSVQILNTTNVKLSTVATGRVLRWLADLQAYSFTPQHTPGKSNVVADALSRFPVNSNIVVADVETALLCQQTLFTYPTADFTRHFHDAYNSSPSLKHIFDSLRQQLFHPRFQLYNDLIVTRESPPRVFVPNNTTLRELIFKEAHDTPFAGHPGFHKMFKYISKRFFGPRLRHDVLDYVRSCPSCQIAKPRHTRPFGALMPLQPPEAPWQDISLDLITQLPRSDQFDAILVIVDRFSKMAHFFPTTTTVDAPTLARIFQDGIVRLHGFPRSIVSDRDPRFLSSFWRELFELAGTTLRFSTANHPQTDGQTERTNRTLEQYLRIFARHAPSTWSSILTHAELCYNNSTHSATGFTPFFLVYNHHPNFPLDLFHGPVEGRNDAVESLFNSHQSIHDQTRDALTKAAEAMTRHSRSGPPAPFTVGDSVLVHRTAFRTHRDLHELKKFDDRWLGPFEITKVVNANAYQLQLPPNFKKHNTINITFLHPYRQSQRFPRPHPDSVRPAAESYATSDDDDDGEYEVESILNHRIALSQHRQSSLRMTVPQQLQITENPHDFEFLVKWKGYSMDENTWEPIVHLEHAKEVLRNYLISKQLPIDWFHVFDDSQTRDNPS